MLVIFEVSDFINDFMNDFDAKVNTYLSHK